MLENKQHSMIQIKCCVHEAFAMVGRRYRRSSKINTIIENKGIMNYINTGDQQIGHQFYSLRRLSNRLRREELRKSWHRIKQP